MFRYQSQSVYGKLVTLNSSPFKTCLGTSTECTNVCSNLKDFSTWYCCSSSVSFAATGREIMEACAQFSRKKKKSADCFKRPSNAQRWDGGQESKSVNQSGRLRTKLYRESRNLSEARFEYRSKRAKDETRTVIIKQIKTFFGVRMKNWSQNKNRNNFNETLFRWNLSKSFVAPQRRHNQFN